MTASRSRDFEQLAAKLRGASAIVVLTGAGMSAESGIPTFREAQTGLWARYDPQQLATPQAFQRQPGLVWDWYTWRRELIAKAKPNPGHLALVSLQHFVPDLLLVTQNVDGLHQIAGSQGVIELHGNIRRTVCADEGRIVTDWQQTGNSPPRCPFCGGLLRPDVVWYGESLPRKDLFAAVEGARNCDLFLSIGTSAVVQPAASLALEAMKSKATVCEMNLEPTPLSTRVDISIRGKVGQLLPALVNSAFPS